MNHQDRVRRNEEWCWNNKHPENPALEGCSGLGRPSCTATECMVRVAPDPKSNGFISAPPRGVTS